MKVNIQNKTNLFKSLKSENKDKILNKDPFLKFMIKAKKEILD